MLAFAWGYAWRVPFIPDALGTALVALRWGPGAALLAAVAASGLEALLIAPSRLAFLPARLLTALILGYGARAGWAAKWRGLLLLSLAQGAAVGVTAGLIQIFAFRGFSGEPLVDLLTAAASMALPPAGAALTVRLTTSVLSAMINNLLAWRLLPALRRRTWGRAAVSLAGATLTVMLALSLPARPAAFSALPGPLPLSALTASPPAAETPTIVQLHLAAGEQADAACVGCHGGKRSEVSLRPDIAPPHTVHLNSPLLNFNCTDCHASVDLAQEAAAGLRRQVDAALCAACHSAFPTAMPPEYQDMDCLLCHSNWQTRMAGVSVVNLEAISPGDCAGCHGERAWYAAAEERTHR